MAKNKKGKTLQKFTDLGKIKYPKDVRGFLTENPDRLEELRKDLYKRLQNSYEDKLQWEEEIIVMIEELSKIQGKDSNIRNYTYEYNHHLITSSIHNSILKNGVFPTAQTIAHEIGLSRQTVHNHIKDGSFNKYNGLVKGRVELMASMALERLYKIGIEDSNASALKSFIELSGAYRNTPNNVTNYIQINNLKLSYEDFNQLPEKALTRIEKIIYKELEKENKQSFQLQKKEGVIIEENNQ